MRILHIFHRRSGRTLGLHFVEIRRRRRRPGGEDCVIVAGRCCKPLRTDLHLPPREGYAKWFCDQRRPRAATAVTTCHGHDDGTSTVARSPLSYLVTPPAAPSINFNPTDHLQGFTGSGHASWTAAAGRSGATIRRGRHSGHSVNNHVHSNHGAYGRPRKTIQAPPASDIIAGQGTPRQAVGRLQ